MSEENSNDIIKKYKSGTSSLEEEKLLFNSAEKMDEPLKIWADFVKQNQKEIPENLNDKLWESFEEKTKKSNKFKIGILSTAASIALIFSLFIYNNNQNTLTETEKQALLNEAKNMFIEADEEKAMYRKILENELVIVYAKTQ
ncbi:MAG: hypothetical protein ACJA1B_000027 [Polaribacter sp.]|jgi:hypothetical protein